MIYTRPLATEVLKVLQDVLVHQRPRWSSLLLHQHQYEGWWKAEIRTALDAWCWRNSSPPQYGVTSEARPRDFGLHETRESFDLVVGAWDHSGKQVLLDRGPRVWIELKERATWWGGGPRKAFGEANSGLRADLKKWSAAQWTEGDIAIACQIISHESSDGEYLPADWKQELDAIAKVNPRCLPTARVGAPSMSANHTLWATVELFSIHGAEGL